MKNDTCLVQWFCYVEVHDINMGSYKENFSEG